MLALLDVLHLFALEGPRLPKALVVAYLHRASKGGRSAKPRSQVRAYERLKQRLRQLGIHVRTELDEDGTAFLVVPRAARWKSRLERAYARGALSFPPRGEVFSE